MKKSKLINSGKLTATSRYFKTNMENAMKGSIERGLVELITNSDDSYRDIEATGAKAFGGIRIEIDRRLKGKSIIKIKDRAEGMSREEMELKILKMGGRTSGTEEGYARRGLHGRGAKDIVALGAVHFYSVKGNEYTHLVIKQSLDYDFTEYMYKIKPEIRAKLPIPKGNGTVVLIEVNHSIKIPQHEHLISNLSRYYSLRDINSNPDRKIILADINKKREDRILYRYPEGEEIFREKIGIPEYPDAYAELVLFQHKDAFERDRKPYREGIVIKGKAAIYDCTYFDLEAEPYSWRFSGVIDCPYIDVLVKEYDDLEEKGVFEHSSLNPFRMINPERDGFIMEHPFIEKLFGQGKLILRTLVEKLKNKEEPQRNAVSNENLDQKFEDLSRAISPEFEKDLIDLQEEIIEGTDPGGIANSLPNGLHIIPGGEQYIVNGSKKTFSVILKEISWVNTGIPINITCNNPAFKLNKTTANLIVSDHPNIAKTTFAVVAPEVGEQAVIEVDYDNSKKQVSVISTESQVQKEWEFGLAFEKQVYHIIPNKEKSLLLHLKTKSQLKEDIVKITSSNNEIRILGGGICKLKKTGIDNQYIGKCRVKGIRLHASGQLMANLQGYETAEAKIIIEDKNKSKIKFEYHPEESDFRPLRYKWDSLNSFLLIIGAKHPTIRRYLGEPAAGVYPGITSPLYHTVLAEVIAEALSFLLLKRIFNREGESMDYDTTDLYYHRYFSKYLEIAHKKLVEDVNVILADERNKES